MKGFLKRSLWKEKMAILDAPAVLAAPMSEQTVHVRTFSSNDESRWDEFVRQNPESSIFQLVAWKRVIEKTFGYEPIYFLTERANKITGIAPVFFVSDWLGGHRLISIPLGVYGGICSSHGESRELLIDTVKQECFKRSVDYLELRNRRKNIDLGFHANTLYVTFTTALTADVDANLKRLPRDTRYMIRKAEKAGLRTERGFHLKDIFYRLFSQSMHRLGTPVLPRALFDNLQAEFGNESEFTVVYSGSKPVSAVLSFFFRDTVLPYYAGASLEAPKLGANNFMYWDLMKRGAQAGFERFDFGRSKKGTGSYAFKTQWNMDVEPLNYEVLLVRRKTVPNFSPVNPKFERAIRLWRRMPLWMANAMGPHVVRWLP
jgi:FemAB-related protein (PEP-CTERM system-associated)